MGYTGELHEGLHQGCGAVMEQGEGTLERDLGGEGASEMRGPPDF